MKFKQDFVTNSSSSCFIISVANDPELEKLRKDVVELDAHPDAGNEGVRIYETFSDINHLNEYTNDGPLDWAQKPRGPSFNNIGQSMYEACKKIVNAGKIAVYMSVDYNVVEQFQEKWYGKIAELYY